MSKELLNNKLRIGISCYPTFGGSGVVASALGMELAALGHKVHIISYAPPARIKLYHPNLHFHKVEVTDYPLFEYPPYSLSLASSMVEVAQTEKLDLLHVHYAIPHAVSAYLAQEMLGDNSIPFVTTLHGTDITLVGNAPSFMPITKFVLEKSDAVTAVSNFLKQETLNFFKVDRDIAVIPNFIRSDLDDCSNVNIRRSTIASDNEAIIVHISNFRPVKRISDVMQIFSRIRKEKPAKLLMVGDGPERAPAERMARELKVQDDVYFLGMQLEISDILRLADVLLQPSETESFGLTPLEANACCTPVICSNVGGLPEVIVDGETGFLLPVGDVDAMADKALMIINDDELRRKMDKAGRKRAREVFNAARIVNLYLDIYHQVLSG
ncbi:N-acetyl-alpha-D-glucosaminyl L-malate synthase BshA [candidate division LCP-89 bacterium B3_LCP]|uniref:N-acetyl-alpha-D-glucosaminyl L-malate synthase BshA n=1 Tax=candidate division LCP-89 bacterium B3_LCP TaxID=2012998 RepID=A0A532UPU2_UNCL8|nr:MAG: N-acetyl-alpha-D-glucosaminyl L-malate synthase BshA [candidate division LCP-89 bacterium B3_LCP]